MVEKKKILTWDEALEWRKKSKEKGLIVVFTNGCYDVLHYGHVQLLEKAKEKGDLLVVGINGDESVTRLKGKDRPIRKEEERAEILGGLVSVDAVVVFHEDDPLKLILHLMPDVLVKGGDWKIENIIGAKEVKGNGGKVFSLPLLEGRSTTSTVEKIKGTGGKNS